MHTKRYVGVYSYTTPEGALLPFAIRWPDGRRFSIDEVLDKQQAFCTKAGGTGVRYTIRVGQRVTRLWQEDVFGAQQTPRWFVEQATQ